MKALAMETYAIKVEVLHRVLVTGSEVTRVYKTLVFDADGYELYKITGGSIVGYDQLSCTKGIYVRKYFHRVITNCPEDRVVDHINGNSLDNRLCNLRICSRQDNQGNLRTQVTKRSGLPKGVFKDSRYGTYYAKLVRNYVPVHLGTFSTIAAAEAAYKAYAAKIQGDFAYHVSREQAT